MKRRITTMLAWGLLGGAMALAGCSGSAAEADSASAAQAEMNQDPAPGGLGHVQAVRDALSHVVLRPDQKTQIDKLSADTEARHEEIKTARQALHTAIADQVQAGHIDRAALQPQVDALMAAVDKVRPLDRAAFVQLHDLLDPQQRNVFVDAMEAGARQRMEHRGEHGSMRKWAADLNLSDAQRDQIKGALHAKFNNGQFAGGPREVMHQQMQTARLQGKQVLESFRQDQFTLDANSPVLFGRDRIEHMAGKMLDTAEVVVPLLTPDQRGAAAAKIRTGTGIGHGFGG